MLCTSCFAVHSFPFFFLVIANFYYSSFQGTTHKEVILEKESFDTVLNEFCCRYDLSGSGIKYREEQDKKLMSFIQNELTGLEAGYTECGKLTIAF